MFFYDSSVNERVFLARRAGFLLLFRLNLLEIDGVSVYFYLEACLTSKRTQIRHQRRSLSLSRRVLAVFFNFPLFNKIDEERRLGGVFSLPFTVPLTTNH